MIAFDFLCFFFYLVQCMEKSSLIILKVSWGSIAYTPSEWDVWKEHMPIRPDSVAYII